MSPLESPRRTTPSDRAFEVPETVPARRKAESSCPRPYKFRSLYTGIWDQRSPVLSTKLPSSGKPSSNSTTHPRFGRRYTRASQQSSAKSPPRCPWPPSPGNKHEHTTQVSSNPSLLRLAIFTGVSVLIALLVCVVVASITAAGQLASFLTTFAVVEWVIALAKLARGLWRSGYPLCRAFIGGLVTARNIIVVGGIGFMSCIRLLVRASHFTWDLIASSVGLAAASTQLVFSLSVNAITLVRQALDIVMRVIRAFYFALLNTMRSLIRVAQFLHRGGRGLWRVISSIIGTGAIFVVAPPTFRCTWRMEIMGDRILEIAVSHERVVVAGGYLQSTAAVHWYLS